ncbi:SLAM family member 5-like [Megalops cyprinoides]|uniref:SLAM family member 5-like n=1 Tax=Megalops cyprinoides TaxID=118141 RepID=UPI0018646FE9|nr:SLAM family member 5-like [Megalops cyprinoides]
MFSPKYRMNNGNNANISRQVFAVNALFHLMGFLCGGSEELAVAVAGSITNVTVGESVLFPVSPEGENSYKVNLNFRSSPIVTWYSETNDSYFHNQYKDRISIHDAGPIYLNTVQLSDSGLYQIKIQYSSGDFRPPTYSDFHLQVFEPVSSPTITVECLGNNISLSCSSSQGSEVTYSWETLPPCSSESCIHFGQTIEMDSFPQAESVTYRCTAQNPVSRASSDPMALRGCSTQGAKVDRWIPALCGILFTLFLTGAVMCLYKKKKRDVKVKQIKGSCVGGVRGWQWQLLVPSPM